MPDSFQKRDRDRKKREKRQKKQAKRHERAALKSQRAAAPPTDLYPGRPDAPQPT